MFVCICVSHIIHSVVVIFLSNIWDSDLSAIFFYKATARTVQSTFSHFKFLSVFLFLFTNYQLWLQFLYKEAHRKEATVMIIEKK